MLFFYINLVVYATLYLVLIKGCDDNTTIALRLENLSWSYNSTATMFLGITDQDVEMTGLTSPNLNWKLGCYWTGHVSGTLLIFTYNPLGEAKQILSLVAQTHFPQPVSNCYMRLDSGQVSFTSTIGGPSLASFTIAGIINGFYINNTGEIWVDNTGAAGSNRVPITAFCNMTAQYPGAHRFSYQSFPMTVVIKGSKKCSITKEILSSEIFVNPTSTKITYELEVDTSLTTTQTLTASSIITLTHEISSTSSFDVSSSLFGISSSYGFSTTQDDSESTSNDSENSSTSEFSTTSIKKLKFEISPNSSITINKFKFTQGCHTKIRPPFVANMMESTTGLKYTVPLNGQLEKVVVTTGTEYNLS